MGAILREQILKVRLLKKLDKLNKLRKKIYFWFGDLRYQYQLIQDVRDGKYSSEESWLNGARLAGLDFRGANLSYGNFAFTDFHGANLRGANLRGANLEGVNFQGTDLHWADLRDADLNRANLKNADLRGAKDDNACIIGVKWDGALQDEEKDVKNW